MSEVEVKAEIEENNNEVQPDEIQEEDKEIAEKSPELPVIAPREASEGEAGEEAKVEELVDVPLQDADKATYPPIADLKKYQIESLKNNKDNEELVNKILMSFEHLYAFKTG